jgi:integrase
MGDKRIGLREIRALEPGQAIWDADVHGFGARRQQSKVRPHGKPARNGISYVLFYRTAEGRMRWHTIGRHGSPWTPDMARDEAKRLLGEVVRGGDPAAQKIAKRKASTVAELCDLYLKDAETGRLLTRRKGSKKPSTIATDKGRIERHIKPLLGSLRVPTVSREDVESFMHAVAEGKTAARTKTSKKRGLARVRGGKGTASRTIGLLGSIFTYAVRHRMRPDNPVRGVIRYADGRRDRRLRDEEYGALGSAIAKAEAKQIWPAAIAAARFLTLTGWRLGEALGLRWDEVDLVRRTATLTDTKTGRSVRPLSKTACEVLRSLTCAGALVFPATRGDGRMAGFPKLWAKIAKLGELPNDVTPHTLRHSFASLAGDLGYSELTIAALVGHKGLTITSRYVHAADAVLLSAADAVADRTAELMGKSSRGRLIPNKAGFPYRLSPLTTSTERRLAGAMPIMDLGFLDQEEWKALPSLSPGIVVSVCRLQAYMWWPTSEADRVRYLAKIVGSAIAALERFGTAAKGAIVVDRDKLREALSLTNGWLGSQLPGLGGWTALTEGPSLEEYRQAMGRAMRPLNIAGRVLLAARAVHFRFKGTGTTASINRGVDLVSRVNGYSATEIREAWSEFGTVAHLSGANILLQANPASLPEGLKAHDGSFSPFRGLPVLLKVAEELQDFGFGTVPRGRRVPLLDPTRTWRLPELPPMQDLVLLDEPSISHDIRLQIDSYRARPRAMN